MSLLSVEGLQKSFGGVVAAMHVSFSLEAGVLLAVIGPNGAGKSTIFNMLGGQLRPDRGRIVLAGTDITGLPPRRIWRLGVGRTFQIAQTFLSMSVIENVQMALMSLAGRTRAAWARRQPPLSRRGEALIARVGVEAAAQRPCSELAYGDVKRVELAIALASAPKLLLMDEPTAGMAAGERAQLMTLIGGIARERGIGVLFTEHDMDAVFDHADAVLVLVRGEIIARGRPAEVRADPIVRQVYLGRAAAGARLEIFAHAAGRKHLLLDGIDAAYGRAQVLFGVSLRLERGETVALMGRNGAGKSTTLKAIMGLLPVAAGSIRFAGQEISGLPTYRIARLGLGYVPEDRRIFTDLSVFENLEVGAKAAPSEGHARWTPERLFSIFPEPCRDARPAGRSNVGRRAADAQHCPHLDGQSASHFTRRTDRRAGARHRR